VEDVGLDGTSGRPSVGANERPARARHLGRWLRGETWAALISATVLRVNANLEEAMADDVEEEAEGEEPHGE
jgi:citrate lyase beta subunit